MGSPDTSVSPVETGQGAPETSSLDEAAYIARVLGLPTGRTEFQLDHELEAKARKYGISTTSAFHNESDKRYTSSTETASTAQTPHTRSFSTSSNNSASTVLTSHSSLFTPTTAKVAPKSKGGRPVKNLNFSQYEKYLSQIDKNLDQPKFRKAAAAPVEVSARSLFSVRTKRSLFSIKSGVKEKIRWRRRSVHPVVPTLSCVCCRDDFNKGNVLYSLPCGHTYCDHCLRVMIQQSITEESKMPPRCCTQPIPADTVQGVLTRENQLAFLKAVVQFSTPWESRIFCPNSSCGEFVPRRHKVDVKQPFNLTCHRCDTRICVMCKRNAHPVGRDCPEDWELEQVLKMGEKSGWRRCYKCRNLVELAQGCTHMTCRCKAQFCYICGGVWDAEVGCPNVCNGEEELERRRQEEEDRKAELEAERAVQEAAAAADAAERLEAEERSENHQDMKVLIEAQWEEKRRFDDFDGTVLSDMRERHNCKKQTLSDKQTDLEEKMRERHAKTAAQLEDRQVAAELELRTTLEQSERSVRVRLKHMEAYCDGLGRNNDTFMPQRTVTERDLRELGQQYNLRDNLERIHQSKINVLRDRQAKRMEELLERQEAELSKLQAKRQEEMEDLAAKFALETDQIHAIETARKARLQHRWRLCVEVLCKELEEREGLRYAQIDSPSWPHDNQNANEVSLDASQR